VSDVTVQITQPNITAAVTTAGVSANIAAADVAVDVQAAAVTANVETANITVNIAGCVCSGTGAAGATFTGTAGEDIAALDLVYIAADGLIYRADANDEAKEAEGIAPAAIANGASGTVNLGQWSMTGFVGLTSGGRYFLSADTPGSITDAIPAFTVTGGIVQQVGKALSATRFYFDPKISVYDGGTGAVGDYFITEGGDSFITEGGDFLIQEAAASYLLTEGGDTLITEGGDALTLE